MKLYCRIKNENFGGPYGALGAQYRYRHSPIECLANFEWNNGMTLYCRIKNKHFGIGPHMGLLGAIWGPMGHGALGSQEAHG